MRHLEVRPNSSNHLRLARPSKNLEVAEEFWVDGLGLKVLHRSGPEAEGGHALLMVGWPEAAWHLELVAAPENETLPSPTEEDLLVLYLDGPVDPEVVERLVMAGGRRVQARNPYWDRWGVMVEDPDGYRLVLSSRHWESTNLT